MTEPRTRTPLRVTVWGESVHERVEPEVAARYPDGMRATVAAGIAEHVGDTAEVRTATLQQPEHGLTQEVLTGTDELTWWGHAAHDEVADEVVERVHRHEREGMGGDLFTGHGYAGPLDAER